MTLIPVNPLRTDDGDLVSLTTLRGKLRAQPIPLDNPNEIQNVIVAGGASNISVSLATNLGVGTIFTGTAKASEFGYWLDAVASADSATKPTDANIVNKTRWGYGLRIMFRVQQLDASASLNFATIGANVQLGLLSASYEVQTLGLGPLALTAILDGISQFGTINRDTFADLNTTVIDNVKKVIADPQAILTVRPLAVQVNFPVEQNPIDKAQSEVFAMRRIREGTDLKDALAKAGLNRSVDDIRAVYLKVAGNIPEDQKPPQSARDFAKAWLG